MHTPRIGIMGPANAGKDTAAAMLSEMTGFPVRHFSDALYREVAAAFRIPEHRLRCRDYPFRDVLRAMDISLLQPLSPRQVLEWWGTNYRRAVDWEYWRREAMHGSLPGLFEGCASQTLGKGGTSWSRF